MKIGKNSLQRLLPIVPDRINYKEISKRNLYKVGACMRDYSKI